MSASAPRVLVLNLNPRASTRSGTRTLIRAIKRLLPSHATVLERHFQRVSPSRVTTIDPDAILLGPQGVPFDAYPESARSKLFELLRALDRPTLGVCGGHQALVLAHGGTLAPVQGGVATGSYDGLEKLRGLFDVRLKRDALTEGLPCRARFFCSHVEGVSHLPDAFSLIGEGDPARIQAVRLGERPVWGVQFHPEMGGDGELLLRRFLDLAIMDSRETRGGCE